MPPRVERSLARVRLTAAFWGPLSLIRELDDPRTEVLFWRWTWEWRGVPEDEQERRRSAFRDALRPHGWSEDAIENVWLHPYRCDMLEHLRQHDPQRCREWEAAMQQVATPAGMAEPRAAPKADRRFRIRNLDADESDRLLREVLSLSEEQGLDSKSIGIRLGPEVGDDDVPDGTVRSWLREARKMRAEGLI